MHELFHPQLLTGTARERATFATECDFLFAGWISAFSHQFLSADSKIGANAAHTLTAGSICSSWEPEIAPSGTTSRRAPARHRGTPWSSSAGSVPSVWKSPNLEAPHLIHFISTVGRGTPSSRGVLLNLLRGWQVSYLFTTQRLWVCLVTYGIKGLQRDVTALSGPTSVGRRLGSAPWEWKTGSAWLRWGTPGHRGFGL